jgi:signal transduction histidine kinase
MTIIFITFIYSALVAIVYFKKDKIKSEETTIYNYLIFLSIINLINEFSLCLNIILKIPLYSFYNLLLNRLFLVFLFSWYMLFTYYILSLIFKNSKKLNDAKLFKKFAKIFPIFVTFIIIMILILPIKLVDENGYAYSTGLAVNFMFSINIIIYIIVIFILFIHYKEISYKKMVPFVALMACLAAVILCRFINPGILLNSFSVAFPTILMYFTIENPDLKMIEELSKAQILSEKTNAEKTNFLYDITKDINNSLDKTTTIYENVMAFNPNDNIKEEMNSLKTLVNEFRIKTKNTIDVSEMDSKYLKPTTNKYNIKLLLNSISLQVKDKIQDNIDYRLNINEGLPDELYGDPLKVKQIILSLIDNSIKFTKEGYIELRINSIIKNDVCRLIMVIEDSGTGIDLLKQNEILSNHEDLTSDELNNLDNNNLNLKTIRKMINLIGGTMTIDSSASGTSVKVVLDQKLVELIKTKEEEQINEYSKTIQNKINVALISQDEESKKLIKHYLIKANINVLEFLETKQCLDDLRNDKKFAYIIIDENMDKIDARLLLAKMKNENLSGKVVVLSTNKDIRNKKELLDLGFDLVLTIPINKAELKEKIFAMNK